jgi:alpha-beta hydrolase superfamily lysophospholipase
MGALVEPMEVRATAGRKLALHFGRAGRPLFGFFHPPADGPWRATGVVLCPPIGTDYTRSDRAYRHLAERLAASGFACLRFDLSGTGDSGGDEDGAGLLQRWLDDVGVAIDELRARSGAEAIALVGLRLGGTLAMAQAAERGDVDSLVLWTPCVSGAGFVGEVTKLHKLYTRIEPHLAEAPAPHADGEEALGLFMPRALVDDLARIDLLETTRRPAKRTLVVDGGGVAARDALVARLRELGAAPELRSHPGHKFLITVSHRSTVPDEQIDDIVAWLRDAHPTGAVPPPLAPRALVPPPAGERLVVFGEGHPLFGILTPADPARARRGRPGIVLTNAGCVNRSGPHRTYVRMARRWAKLGFDVLRVDLPGIGDTPAVPGEKENLTYPPTALDDLGLAMRALGSERAVIAGLCSGGDYAFQLGARDPRVAAAWMLNPRTFCVLALAAVESGAPPTTSVDDVPRALRAMAGRGVDTVLVVSRNDPGVVYVDTHAQAEMAALAGVPGFHRVDLRGADHSFTPVTLQERVSDILSERLSALDGSPVR